jgi:nitrogen-specific signal transduction histidine kinase
MALNIYQNKTRLKLLLLFIAMLIALVTLWYTNQLANRIASDEEKKVKLWAEAIENKAKIVKYTNDLFLRISESEKSNANLWAGAINIISSTTDDNVLTYLSSITTSNKNTPMLLVNEDMRIIGNRNIEGLNIEDSIVFRGRVEELFSKYPPILIDTRIADIRIVNFVYYLDSKIFTDLKTILKDLLESFVSEVVINSASVPVILVNEKGEIEYHGNLEKNTDNNVKLLRARLEKMKSNGKSITLDLGPGKRKILYYENSATYNQLKFFPFIQLSIFAGFLFIGYLAFSGARRVEENQVWVGMSKETAHQMGTPLSSLNAWVELLKDSSIEELKEMNIAEEIEKDVIRLSLVADRFSKIGSKPELKPLNLEEIIEDTVAYFKVRTSLRTEFEINKTEDIQEVKINKELFIWVLENLIKNAIDAMEGIGSITVNYGKFNDNVYIDIIDTGKGVPKGSYETIFQPGYTTKARGWGLGLSLCKRIIVNYHKGKIFVKDSKPGQGTTFRILLPD